jgi:hypothetical protein
MNKNYEINKTEMSKVRNDLKNKIHLFQEGIEDIWNSTESKWIQYDDKLEKIKSSTGQSKEEIGVALELLKYEINDSYKRILASIK